MKTNEIVIRQIVADEGKVLVKGDVVATEVYLGVNDSAYNWVEMDKEDAPKQNEECNEALDD